MDYHLLNFLFDPSKAFLISLIAPYFDLIFIVLYYICQFVVSFILIRSLEEFLCLARKPKG